MYYHVKSRRLRTILIVSIWLYCASAAVASTPVTTLAIDYPIASPYYPVILRGAQLAPLLGEHRANIVAYIFHGGRRSMVPLQIDRRDAHGQLLLDDAMPAALARAPQFTAEDECVFMAGDLGERAPTQTADAGKTVELVLHDAKTNQRGRVYLVVEPTAPAASAPPSYVHYLAVQDALQSATYRLGFSRAMPMLAQSLQWFDPQLKTYGVNLIDTMKIRHYGRFLGGFSFRRGVEDYRSVLVGIRSGPVRVIRRTENSIRVLLGFRSPTITVDYIGYAHAILADIRLKVPFRPDWFFSDLVSITTWDGNDTPDYPPSHVYSRSVPQGFTIDGHMNDAKRRFNDSGDSAFALVNRYGTLLVTMDFAADEPIRRAVYLVDDRSVPDPPENVPGQFGNLGFRMTGWEKLARGTHHLTYRALLINGVSVSEGLRLLEDAPAFY